MGTLRQHLCAALLSLIVHTGAILCASAQELVISTGNSPPSGPGPLVVIGDLATQLPNPRLFFVAPYYGSDLPAVNPHGFALLNRDTAVASNITSVSIVDVIDIPSAQVTAFFHPDNTYSVGGSVAVDPAGTHVLLTSGTGNKLFVVPTPLSATSIASAIIDLPGNVDIFQTHAITFDVDSGRAYIGHTNGITAIDPPYAAGNVAYTIDLSASSSSYAIEISPDKSILMASNGTHALTIVHAPFSATSTFEELPIVDSSLLDAVAFLPDGSKALVVDADGVTAPGARLYAVSSPFSSVSIVETLLLPPGMSVEGFEDLAISPDGQYAALAGQSQIPEPLIIVRAPFTTAGFTAYAIPLPYLGPPFGPSGRGDGTAHFWPQPSNLPPQITIDRASVTEGDSGTRLATLTVMLSQTSAQTVSVEYATTDLTAHAGVDYAAAGGTLTFAPGNVRETLTVPIIGNLADVPNDLYFRVQLSNPVHATVLQLPNNFGYGDGVCTIVDDDGPYIATEPPIPDAYVGIPYEATFSVANFTSLTGGSASNLPPGLSLTSITGSTLTVGGTPTVATIPFDQNRFFTLQADGPIPQMAMRTYELNVREDLIFANGFDGGEMKSVKLHPIERSVLDAPACESAPEGCSPVLFNPIAPRD